MLKEGVFLGKRYEILERIGSGGMADVYKSKDHKLNRFVAVKVLKSDYRNDEVFIQKFVSEAQAAAGLMHPNVVNVYDVGQDRGLYYMVMELVEGITLKDYIEKKQSLSAKETISIAIQMMTGIQAAHNHHIIHRDIKPQNIIISRDGKVKVTDFGIARATTSTNTISTNVMGSVHYTSPEQARGGVVDEKSDIYSAGITMFEMITGHVPFDGDSTVTVAVKHLKEEMPLPSKEVPDIPHSLECIIMKCTQKSVAKRYQDCQEVITDLKHSLVDPDGDFVNVIYSGQTGRMASRGTETVVMSDEEIEQVKRRNLKSRDSRDAVRRDDRTARERVRARDYDEEDDYDDDDYDDDYDEQEERRRAQNRREKERRRNGDSRGTSKNSLDPDTQKIMKILLVVAAVVVVLVGALLLSQAAGLFKSVGPSTNTETDEKVAVPNLLNMTESQAKKALNDRNLGYAVSERRASNQYEEGHVMEQSVAANKKIEKNTTVYVVVSAGPEIKDTYVPNVVGKSEEEAEKLLAEKNLVADAEAKYDETVEEGKVISTEPSAGAEVKEGDHIKVYISLGAEKVEVPNVVGWLQSDAESTLKNAGFKVSVTEEYDNNYEAGTVVSQSPANPTKAAKGTTISLTVSKGKKTEYVTVPSLYKMTKDQAKRELEKWGLKLGEDFVQYDNNIAAGLVIDQEYQSGSQVEKGTAINVVISAGPDETGQPDSGGGNADE